MLNSINNIFNFENTTSFKGFKKPISFIACIKEELFLIFIFTIGIALQTHYHYTY